jgi:hypothetical protein
MHNYFAIETEADHRRREWERAAQAEALAAQNHATRPRANRSGWALIGLASLRSFVAPWLPLAAIVPTRCRVATC